MRPTAAHITITLGGGRLSQAYDASGAGTPHPIVLHICVSLFNQYRRTFS